jgi:hypothetical protein
MFAIKLVSKNLSRASGVVLFCAITFSTIASQSHANTKTIDRLEISGLGNYRGQYLSLYYGTGSRASFSVGTSYFDIFKVMFKRTVLIESDIVISEAVVLSLVGFTPRRPNFIGIAIHPNPEVTFLNPDSSVPENENPNNSRSISRLDSLTFRELELYIAAQTINGVKPGTVKYKLR